jgi:hypothetical protein
MQIQLFAKEKVALPPNLSICAYFKTQTNKMNFASLKCKTMKKTVNTFIQESIAKHFLSHDPTWQRMPSCRASPHSSYPHNL